MSTIKGLMVAAALGAAAGPALAAPARLSDVQFVEASRCAGLMSSKALATDDAAAMKSFVEQQSRGRESMAWDMADQARNDALGQASRAGPEERARLIAERDGACRALLGQTTEAGGGMGAAAHGAIRP